MTDTDSQARDTTERGLARRTIMKAAAIGGTVGSGLNVLTTTGSAHEDHELENTITIQATGELASYKFTVNGDVKLGPNAGGGEDVINGNTVTGKVAGRGSDTFRFSGHITSFEFLRGDAKVLVNGEVVQFLPPRLPHKITFQAQGETVPYKFSVSGRIEPLSDARDVVRNGTASSKVAGQGEDSFRFSGHITTLDTGEGPLKVLIDFDEAQHPDP